MKKFVKTGLYIAVAVALIGTIPSVQATDHGSQNATETLQQPTKGQSAPQQEAAAPDLSGRKRVGKGSFYADRFAGRPMADGMPMDPEGDNAASRTLPLGTRAKVTNVETGKTAVVTIEDRGPYVKGRVVDLSPATARQIGITPQKGVATVVVAPISVPTPDGKVKAGAAAYEPQDKPDTLPLSGTDASVTPGKGKARGTRLASASSSDKHDK